MSTVIKQVTQTLFEQYGIHRVWARPFEHNKASQQVLVKAGFIYEGLLKESVYKKERYLNATMYALLASK